MLNVVIATAFVYIAICLLMYVFQRSLQYHPNIQSECQISDFGSALEPVKTVTSDGLTLQHFRGTTIKGAKLAPTVVYFHGNAGTACGRSYRAQYFLDAGYNIFLTEYRGYGGHDGTPTEAGFIKDAQSVMDYLTGQSVTDIILYGESIGTGVAVQVAANHDVRAVILEAPFSSAADVAKGMYPFMPIRYLVKDKFESIQHIKDINAPLLIMHGDADRIIPIHLGIKLFDAAVQPKTFRRFNGASHVIEFEKDDAKTVVFEFLNANL